MANKFEAIIAYLYFSILIFTLFYAAAAGIFPKIDSIYQFGDSLSDTGNLIRVPIIGPTLPAARLPYGQTFPGKPTGRWSDGRLIIDFTAEALGLPLLNPYLDKNASFSNGVNFAVAGSTALNISFLAQKGVIVPIITVPLPDQINLFKSYLSSNICSNQSAPDCKEKVARSLFQVGEIGGNDVNYGLAQGRTIQEIMAFVPNITAAIVNGVKEVIRLGGKRIVVPGNFPIGCLPIYLSMFEGRNPQDYDELGCIRSLNNLAIFQNKNLQQALVSLRMEFPDVLIHYDDYYGAFRSVLFRAPLLGFDQSKRLTACCGSGGGQYNYDSNRTCGSPGVIPCSNPSQYINWDGIHLTQAAYRSISHLTISALLSRIH